MRNSVLLLFIVFILGFALALPAELPAAFQSQGPLAETGSRTDDIWIEAVRYDEYIILEDGMWEIDSGSDFYVHFEFDADVSTIDFWIYSIWEKRDNNQDGLLDGNWTYFQSNRTLYFKPDHRMFYQRLQNIPEYTINIGKGLRTVQGDTVLSKDFNLSFKIEELNSDGDDMPDYRDPFPYDPTQWLDSDADGYGDNILGNNPDLFPSDKTQWKDSDGDGHGDNASGYLGDQFPQDPAAWQDTDGDGMPNDINSSITTELVEDEDDDNDGFSDRDEIDLQTDPLNANSMPPDTDGDKIPDGKDNDIDNDGYSNKREEEAGTDPYDPDDHPSLFLPILIITAVFILLLLIVIPIVWIMKTRNEKSDSLEQTDPDKNAGRSRRGGRSGPRDRPGRR